MIYDEKRRRLQWDGAFSGVPDMGPIYTGAPLNENSAEQSGLLR